MSARFLFASLFALVAAAADLPQGQIIERVECAADATQSYALYVPSSYRAGLPSPIVIAFDPGGRGRVPVERFQQAAEKYGYIVAGSNNSRNGSLERSLAAAQAMWRDLAARLAIDSKRIYATGMSGGARVAMTLALRAPEGLFAGVIACSAGFPDATPRKTVPFAVFGTAGTEDFNYLEMRALDRELTSPHHVTIFEGGHTWLSSDLAVAAIEWMEHQAKTAPVAKSKAEKDALKRDREQDQREERLNTELSALAQSDLHGLRNQLLNLKKRASAPDDSPDRRMARRVIAGFSMSVREGGPSVNPDLRKLVEDIKKP